MTLSSSDNSHIGDIQLDLEWMAVVRRTHQYVQPNRGVVKLPAMVEPVTVEVQFVVIIQSII